MESRRSRFEERAVAVGASKKTTFCAKAEERGGDGR